jgi:ATP-dependent protease ClpP protease subunit
MDEETYLSAAKAVELGFADRVVPKPAGDDCPLLHCPRR